MIYTYLRICMALLITMVFSHSLTAQNETIDVPIEDIEVYLNSPFVYTGGSTTLLSSNGATSNYLRSWRFALAPVGNWGLSIISLVVDIEFSITNNRITSLRQYRAYLSGFSAGMAWSEGIFSHSISNNGRSLYWTMSGALVAAFSYQSIVFSLTKRDVYHGEVHLDNFGLFGGGGNSEVIEVIRH